MENSPLNILILGNGFDLSHGLKTDYISFMKHVLESRIRKENTYSTLVNLEDPFLSYDMLKENKFRGVKSTYGLFLNMLKIVGKQNWCDVEKEYFLSLTADRAKPAPINEEFELIKNALEAYLKSEMTKAAPLEQYNRLFKAMGDNVFVINFNYANIYKFYFNDPSRVFNIHGQIEDQANKIIFGYAAEDDESNKLLDTDQNEYLRNIKKYKYKFSHEYERLSSLLNRLDSSGVLSIFGHSCGISDRLIIKQIMNTSVVNSIKIYYYKDEEDYFQKITNISRICRDDTVFKKIVSFPKLTKMPQYDDESESIKS